MLAGAMLQQNRHPQTDRYTGLHVCIASENRADWMAHIADCLDRCVPSSQKLTAWHTVNLGPDVTECAEVCLRLQSDKLII